MCRGDNGETDRSHYHCSGGRGDLQEEPVFKPNQPLAVMWDEGTKKIWYVGYYVDDNVDGIFQGDHLMHAGN